jgi:cytochrome c553
MKSILARAIGSLLLAPAGLAWGEPAVIPGSKVERAVHVCDACHGEGGNSPIGVFPRLAGQQAGYTAEQLKHFRSQKRADSSPQAYMWGISALLDDETIDGLAQHYAAQRPAPGKPGDPVLVERGKKIFMAGIPERNISACASCHGESGQGAAVFPRIAGQHADYIVRQMQEFRTKLRPHGVMGQQIVKTMSDQEMRAVAAYLQANP